MSDLSIDAAASVSLVTNTTAWKYFVGSTEPSGGVIDYGILNGLPATIVWATLAFNDSAWPEANGPFGYDRASPPDYDLGINLADQMYGIASSVYTRDLFSVSASEAASDQPLQLVIDYDDGIIVYLNGVEIARRNVGTENTATPYNTLATSDHAANGDGGSTTGKDETIALSAANRLLVSGENMLACQIFNSSRTSSDLIGRVTLSTTGTGARTLAAPTDAARYFVGVCEPTDTDEESDADIDAEEAASESESDWIELRNTGGTAVDLTGWSLTDDSDKPRKWYFPNGTSIAPNGYLVAMCTGYDVGPADGATYVHTNFKLSADGEYLALVNAEGAVVCEMAPKFPAQSHFHSYARTADGRYVFCDTATPGAANTGNTFTAVSSPPSFNYLGGFYDAGIQLQIVATNDGEVVRYTLDGSEPTATNALCSGALTISANAVVRARCFKTGKVPSAVVTHTHLVAQSAARRSIPAVCFSADPVPASTDRTPAVAPPTATASWPSRAAATRTNSGAVSATWEPSTCLRSMGAPQSVPPRSNTTPPTAFCAYSPSKRARTPRPSTSIWVSPTSFRKRRCEVASSSREPSDWPRFCGPAR